MDEAAYEKFRATSDLRYLGQLIESDRVVLHRIALGRVHDSFVADDLVQELYLRVYEKIQDGAVELRTYGEFRGFIKITIRNMSIDWLRKHKAKTRHEVRGYNWIENCEDDCGESVPEIDRKHDYDLMWNLISDLSPYNQRAIYFWYIDGLSYEEIAELENASVSAIRVRVHRGLKSLKEAAKKSGIVVHF